MGMVKRYINNSNISRFRFWFQIAAFILIMYGGYASINISERIPTFACPYSSGSAGTCYVLAMQHQFHISWGDLFSYRGLAVITGLGTFILFFVIFNKAWCGYICPLGTIQDWMTKLRKLTGISFVRFDKKSFKRIKIIKYIFLALVILIPLGLSNSFFGLPKITEDLSAPFCQVCPGRTTLPLFTLDSSQLFIDFTTKTAMVMSTLGMIFMGIFFVGSFVKKRFFCFLCPMSALQYLFSRIGLLRLTKIGDKCTKCGNCSRVCDIGIVEIAEDIKSKNIVKDDCMMCFKCVGACPENYCLKVSFIGIPIINSTDEGFFKRYSCHKEFLIGDSKKKEIIAKEKRKDE